MTKRLMRAVAVLGLWLSMSIDLPAQSTQEATSSAKPTTNILVLFADDLGSGDLSLHGGVARTPNIDRLAREGVELRRYYGYPLCSPARAALLTGQMPRRFGIAHALGPREAGLPAGLPTLPRTLKSVGYQTWLVGKWHLGVASPPLQSGFDHFYGFEGPEVDYFQHTNRRGDVDWQRNGQTVREEGYSTLLLADEAIHLIQERDSSRPFYLQVAFNAPHFPLSAPDGSLAKYSSLRPAQALRAAVVDVLDDAVGRILEALDEQGLRRNTLVVFLSDNGADQTGSNAPYRSGKGSVYEGGIRVPCLLRWPGQLPAGSTSQQPTCAQDLYPTLAAAVGVELTESHRLDGKNVWPAIVAEKAEARGPFVIAGSDCAIFDGDWKLIETAAGRRSLFHILNDPGETTDVITQHADIAQQLQAKLAEVKQEFSATSARPRPGPGGPGARSGINPRPRQPIRTE